jgi:hypothetical protein
MITSTVRRGEDENDGRFAWVLEVRGVPSECTEVRWEQFVSGGFTIEFGDRTWKYFAAVTTMQRINPRARQFGPWSDDLLPGMTAGPRAVGAYHGASCTGGVLRAPANPRATMRGASADPRGATYRFEDAPGFSIDFGDTFQGKVFTGIKWEVRFVHKLWRAGESQPIHQRQFLLTGRYDHYGNDTRKVV